MDKDMYDVMAHDGPTTSNNCLKKKRIMLLETEALKEKLETEQVKLNSEENSCTAPSVFFYAPATKGRSGESYLIINDY